LYNCHELHWELKTLQRHRLVKPVLAALVAFLFLIAVILAANPSFHEGLHHDAVSGSHFCLACTLVAGLVSPPDAALVAIVVTFILIGCVLTFQAFQFASFDYLLLPGRAPPHA
jgi:hypothetical protein